jgi:mannose-6-phosphate isomerase
MKIYPLKFSPILKDKIWGGTKLEAFYNTHGSKNVGEAWVLSGYVGDESVVCNGELKGKTLPEIIEIYKDELLGKLIYEHFDTKFPLLFKLIDAADNLSIQVHPNDKMADIRHHSFGKTEMWYVIDAEKDSELIIGFKKDTTAEEYLAALKNDTVQNLLQAVKVQRGDVFFIPAGLVHAIGKGVLVAEIQQSSDITYRIYDYKRRDSNGNERELHTDLATEVVDYKASTNPKTDYIQKENETVPLVSCNYFTTNLLKIDRKFVKNLSDNQSFVVYFCLSGKCVIEWGSGAETIDKGETLLVPAALEEIKFLPENEKVTLLEVYIG